MDDLIKQLENDEVLELTSDETMKLQDYIFNETEYDLDDFRMSRHQGIISVWLDIKQQIKGIK